MSGVVSKKLKFKGEKVKKKRSHKEIDGDDIEGALEAGDPTDWIFPTDVLEIVGPSFILLPSTPPTCLAWNPTLQRVYAAAVTLPVAPAGEDELTLSEALEVVEPTDVNHVWVVARLSGNENVITLRSSSGTFLTAAASGSLSASTPSRGPLECFIPYLSTSTSSYPTFSLKSSSDCYISLSTPSGDIKPTIGLSTSSSNKHLELRADVTELGEMESWKVKCQREFVMKARIERLGGPSALKRRLESGGKGEGTVDDEKERNRQFQAWGLGKSVVSSDDRKDLKKARKEGKINEAMLDRRAKLKSDKFC